LDKSTLLLSPTLHLTDLHPSALARALAIFDEKLYRAVETRELVAWAKKQSRDDSPAIYASIMASNRLSAWVATQIVTQTTLKARAKTLQRFVDILQALHRLHCFNRLVFGFFLDLSNGRF
jgi:hypothetical protein